MGGSGDRLIFNLLRELADVIVVGAGTVRIEGYSGAQLGAAQRQHRQAQGQTEIPRWRSSPDRAGWTGICRCSPGPRYRPSPYLHGGCRRDTPPPHRPRRGGRLLRKDPGEVDEAAVLAILGARGMRRVLTKAGRRCSARSCSVTCSTSCA